MGDDRTNELLERVVDVLGDILGEIPNLDVTRELRQLGEKVDRVEKAIKRMS